MKRSIFTALALLMALSAPLTLRAGQTSDFTAAIQDYESGRYNDAAQSFSRLAESGPASADLYYDAGNAWLKAGEIGRAILWYERAKRLDPKDPDLEYNLQYARKLVRDEQPERPEPLYGVLLFWKGWLGLRAWAWGGVLLSIAFWTVLGVRRLTGRPRSAFFPGVVAAAALIFVLAAGYGYIQQDAGKRGVILAPSAEVRSGTTKAAANLFTLHQGVVVSVGRVRGEYVLVRYSANKFGWLPKEDVGII